MLIFSFVLRSIYISSRYGIIESEIPIMSVPIQDPDMSAHKEAPQAYIKNSTPVVILTTKEFFFGDLTAFSTEFSDIRNKFYVPHTNGSPNIPKLLDDMTKWIYENMSKKTYSAEGLLILMPGQNVPTSIVIQTIAELKKSPYFNKVILSSGLI